MGEGFGRQLQRAAHVVAEGGDDDCGQVIAGLVDCGFQAGDVVVFEWDQVRAVFRGDACERGRAPGDCAVVAAAGDEHLAAPGACAGDGYAGSGCVATVLGQQAPGGVGDHVHEQLGQFHQHRGGSVQAIAEFGLPPGGLGHAGVVVAQHDRAPGAHEVDELAPVHVPDAAAVAAGEVLRVARGQIGGVQVSPQAAGDDLPRTFAQVVVDRACGHRRLLRFAAVWTRHGATPTPPALLV